MRGSRGGGVGPDPRSLKINKNIGFLSNTGPDLLVNHKATKPAFNVRPSFVFCWPADDGPLILVIGTYLPSLTKKKRCQNWAPSAKTYLIRAGHVRQVKTYQPAYPSNMIKYFQYPQFIDIDSRLVLADKY